VRAAISAIGAATRNSSIVIRGSFMSTVRFVTVSGRVATVALLALVMSGQAFAEMCVDIDVRFDEREPDSALLESMKKEAASIWESYGVWFRWPATPDPAGCAWAHASFDVLLDHQHQRSASLKMILGSTHLAHRAIDHVPIYIDRKATEALLGSLRREQLFRLLGRLSVGPADVGRALGRVLAHEVGHVLLAAPFHWSRGLMRPTFVAEDLLTLQRDSYTLSPGEVTRLRQRERALNAIACEQTADCPAISMAPVPGSTSDPQQRVPLWR
jgi:hypothetical protein